MKFDLIRAKSNGLRRRIPRFSFILVAVVCVSFAAMNRAAALYILTGSTDSAIVLDGDKNVQDFSSKLVYLSAGSDGQDVTLVSGQDVTVHYNGATVSAQAQTETVSSFLSRLHIVPGPLDIVAVDLSGTDAELTVTSSLTYYDRVVEPVGYETVRVASASLPHGTEQVTQAGVNGTRTAVYEVVWSDGELVSRQFVEADASTAVNQIVTYGTAVASVSSGDRIVNASKNSDGSGLLTFASGATMKFSGTKSMTATAYTAGSGGADTCTATGTTVHVGVVAVDPRVIPLGTKMYIVTNDGRVVYGMAVAEDTGVRGNAVDLYYDTYSQCINFGRRPCTVYLLSD